jgi:hypothetical protein
MASSNKITIRVTTARRHQNIYWSTTGVEGSVNVGQTSGQLLNQPLTDMSSSDAYWNGIVTAVLAEIPA